MVAWRPMDLQQQPKHGSIMFLHHSEETASPSSRAVDLNSDLNVNSNSSSTTMEVTDDTPTPITDCMDDDSHHWNARFHEFQTFIQETGHAHVPLHHPTLGNWIRTQRKDYKHWEEQQQQQVRQQQQGATNSSTTPTLQTQFQQDRQMTLTTNSTVTKNAVLTKRMMQLQSAGFIANVADFQWNIMYQQLVKFYQHHGHARVPSGTKLMTHQQQQQQQQQSTMQRQPKHQHQSTAAAAAASSSSLGSWVQYQRCQYKRGLLSMERQELLNGIQFCWNPKEWQYRDYVRQVQLELNSSRTAMTVTTNQTDATATTPTTTPTTDGINTNDNKKKNKSMKKKSIFDFKLTDGPLGLWMSRQRTLYKKYCQQQQEEIEVAEESRLEKQNHGGLLSYQIELLEKELGFEISMFVSTSSSSYCKNPQPPHFVDWSDRMRQLQDFQRDHGHLNVPRTYTKHANLGSWVAKVRERYRPYYHYNTNHNSASFSLTKSSSSSPRIQERIQDLIDVGFIWDVLEYKWQQKFQQLYEYHDKHGHVNVPDSFGTLGPWVREQRREYAKIRNGIPSRLTPKHAMALNRMGLDWNRQRTIRKENQQTFMKRLKEWNEYYHGTATATTVDGASERESVHDDTIENDNAHHHPSRLVTSQSPSVHSITSPQLRNWVERQRKLYRKWLQGDDDTQLMTDERRFLLEDAGVVHGIGPVGPDAP